MGDFFISGIQQIGIGTADFRKSWDWFIEMFGIDIRILEDDTVAERMLKYTDGKPQKRHACIAISLQGGGGFEIWQYSERKPVDCAFDVSAGDLGIFAAKVKCRDIERFYKEISSKWDVCGPVHEEADGGRSFIVKDLYGNCFQLVEDRSIYIEQGCLTGGIVGGVIGVSDMDASIRFYKEILGYDRIISDTTGPMTGWELIPHSDQKYRRVLMGCNTPRKGAYSKLFGESRIELVQALEREPQKIYEGRCWGDPGFIQICFDVTGMKAFGKFCTEKGFPFTVDSCPGDEHFDMGDASGHFTYVEDPDGTLIEFVETEKIPVAKKLGWYIDMKKRNPEKVLPKFLFRMIGLVSREKINESLDNRSIVRNR